MFQTCSRLIEHQTELIPDQADPKIVKTLFMGFTINKEFKQFYEVSIQMLLDYLFFKKIIHNVGIQSFAVNSFEPGALRCNDHSWGE